MKKTYAEKAVVYADIAKTLNIQKKKTNNNSLDYNQDLEDILLSFSFDDIEVSEQEVFSRE